MDQISKLDLQRTADICDDNDSDVSEDEKDDFLVVNEETGQVVDLRKVLELSRNKDETADDFDGLISDGALAKREEMGSFEEDFNGDKDGDVATAWDGYWKNRRERQQRLWKAAEEGDIDTLDEVLQVPGSADDVNALRDGDKWAALHMAAYAGNVECCALLLAKGAQLNAVNARGQSPIHLASERGVVEVVGILLQHAHANRDLGLIPVHAIVNMQDESGNTALHSAALNGHETICRMLVADGGASAKIRNNLAQTPVGCCMERNIMDAITEEVRKRMALRKARKAVQSGEDSQKNASVMNGGSTTGGGSAVGDRSSAKGSSVTGGDAVGDLGSRLFAELDLELDGAEEVPEYSRTRFHNTLMHNSRQDVVKRFMHMHKAPATTAVPGSLNMRRLQMMEQNHIHSSDSASPSSASKHLGVSPTTLVPPPSTPGGESSLTPSATPTPGPRPTISFKPTRQLVSLRDDQVKALGPDDYTVKALLGQGSFGEVYKVLLNEDPSKLYALKVLRKDKVFGRNLQRYATTERNVLTYAKHPFIVSLHHAFQTTDHLALVLEFCPGGNLQQLIGRCRRLKEAVARLYCAEVLLALEFLHHRKVIYRDLKPENVVLDAQGHVKLTDFGLAKESVQLGVHKTHSFCGSVAYLAPEMLRKEGHDSAVDIYGLGVLLYEMLVGVPPYYSPDKNQLFKNIQTAQLRVPSHVSPQAASLIRALLDRDPSKRLGVADPSEIKNHPFFAGLDFNALLKKDFAILPLAMNPSVQDALSSGFKEAHVPLAPLLSKKESEREQAIKQGGEAAQQAIVQQKEAAMRVADNWTYIAVE